MKLRKAIFRRTLSILLCSAMLLTFGIFPGAELSITASASAGETGQGAGSVSGGDSSPAEPANTVSGNELSGGSGTSGGGETNPVQQENLPVFFAASPRSASGTFSGGSGTEADPYLIASAEDLEDLAELVEQEVYASAYYLQTTNITLGSDDWPGIGSYDHPFKGSYDGGNYTISGMTYSGSYPGSLFVFNDGTIKNLGVVDCNITGSYTSRSGVLCYQQNAGGIIENCYTTGTVTGPNGEGSYAGRSGICGTNKGKIIGCHSACNITAGGYTSGVCGDNQGEIIDCYNEGTVDGGSLRVGGVCGYNAGKVTGSSNRADVTGSGQCLGGVCGENSSSGEISNCYNAGKVSGGTMRVGGVCGINSGAITLSYNKGDVSGSDNEIGGVCGWNNKGTVAYCYNTGKVESTSMVSIGGVCGSNSGGTISSCYSIGTLTVGTSSAFSNYAGGVCGASRGLTDSPARIVDCYYDKSKYSGPTVYQSQNGAKALNTDGKTTAEFASGMVCWLLNGGEDSAETIWYQNVDSNTAKDSAPVLDSSHGTVYATGRKDCPEGDLSSVSYRNTEGGITVTHPDREFNADGYCPYCHKGQPATLNASGYYEIGNAGQLYWFAQQVNSGENMINGRLTANIVVNGDALQADGTLNESVLSSGSFRAWTPMGEQYNRYNGTFDGGGFAVSGLVCRDEDADYVGLFGAVSETGVVRNVCVKDSYLNGGSYVGAICGDTSGVIENCRNEGTVKGKESGSENVGGIAGHNHNGSKIASIKNCRNSGRVSGWSNIGGICGKNNTDGIIFGCCNEAEVVGSGEGGFVGGIAGQSYGEGIVLCYNTGAVSAHHGVGGICGHIRGGMEKCFNTGMVSLPGGSARTDVGALCGGTGGDVPVVLGCYYLDSSCGQAIDGDCDSTYVEAVAKTAEEFASGEVCWLLNDGVTDGTQLWYQRVDAGEKDAAPVFDQDHGTVYASGSRACPDAPLQSGTYNNTSDQTTVSGVHNYSANGFCEFCDGFESATADGDGVYQIDNGGKLYWFAAQVNAGSNSISGKLTANIVLNANVLDSAGEVNSGAFRLWTAIGTDQDRGDAPFQGVFDGDGHTVSGMVIRAAGNCQGLFGYSKGTIRNVGVTDSSVICDGSCNAILCGYNDGGTISGCYSAGAMNAYGGGICGWNTNGGTIADCYNLASLVGVGGVCGSNSSAESTIIRCYNAGSVKGKNEDLGGVCGRNVGTVADCYNTAEISIENAFVKYVGGVCGYNGGSLTNCYSTGAISGTATNVGGVCGYNGTPGITNCYYDTTAYTGGQAVGITTPGTYIPNITAEGRTAEQFASGEVAWLLNGSTGEGDLVWKQTIGADANPKFTGGTVYCGNTSLNCDGTPAVGNVATYTNDPNVSQGTRADHNFENGKCTVCGTFEDSVGAKLAGYTLSLRGNIGVNFFMELDDSVAGNQDAYMRFTLPDGRTKDVRVSDARKDTQTVAGTTYYVFCCEVNASEMTDTIKAQVISGASRGTEYSYTVKEYADYLLAHKNENTEYAEAADMICAMLNYGAYSQIYFEHSKDRLANAGLTDTDVSGVTAAALSSFQRSIALDEEWIKAEGANLTLDSMTTLRLFFTPKTNDTIAFTLNGQPLQATERGGYLCVEIADIPAKDLDTDYTVTVSCGAESKSVQFNAMAYCYNVLSREMTATRTEALKNVIRALYLYNVEANEYFKE